jgi:hypothetical protein
MPAGGVCLCVARVPALRAVEQGAGELCNWQCPAARIRSGRAAHTQAHASVGVGTARCLALPLPHYKWTHTHTSRLTPPRAWRVAYLSTVERQSDTVAVAVYTM